MHGRHGAATAPGAPRGIDGHVFVADRHDDDRRLIASALELYGFEVVSVAAVADAPAVISRGAVDLVVLDPVGESEGLGLVEHLARDAGLPLIVVTSLAAEDDLLTAFRFGADDYVVKPFSVLELVARVVAILSRHGGRRDHRHLLTHDGIEIDRAARQVAVHGVRVHLTPKEYELLVALAARPRRTCSADELLQWVWRLSPDLQDRSTVTEHVRRIRRKLGENVSSPRHLVTVRGIGYRWEP